MEYVIDKEENQYMRTSRFSIGALTFLLGFLMTAPKTLAQG